MLLSLLGCIQPRLQMLLEWVAGSMLLAVRSRFSWRGNMQYRRLSCRLRAVALQSQPCSIPEAFFRIPLPGEYVLRGALRARQTVAQPRWNRELAARAELAPLR